MVPTVPGLAAPEVDPRVVPSPFLVGVPLEGAAPPSAAPSTDGPPPQDPAGQAPPRDSPREHLLHEPRTPHVAPERQECPMGVHLLGALPVRCRIRRRSAPWSRSSATVLRITVPRPGTSARTDGPCSSNHHATVAQIASAHSPRHEPSPRRFDRARDEVSSGACGRAPWGPARVVACGRGYLGLYGARSPRRPEGRQAMRSEVSSASTRNFFPSAVIAKRWRGARCRCQE